MFVVVVVAVGAMMVIVSVIMSVLVSVIVGVIVVALRTVLVGMAVRVLSRVFVCVAMLMHRFTGLHMRGSGVNSKLDPFNFGAFLAFKMHMEIAQIQLGKLPLQRRGFHSQIAQCADCHVAANSRKTI